MPDFNALMNALGNDLFVVDGFEPVTITIRNPPSADQVV